MSDRPCSNTHECTCRNVNCERHGRCCDCIAAHLSHGSLPNCVPDELKAPKKA